MLTHTDMKDIVDRIDLPGHEFRIARARTDVGIHEPLFGPVYLQLKREVHDVDTGRITAHKGRKYLLSKHMTEGEVVQTALVAALAFAEHEIRETFLYRGARVFNPHYDIEALVDFASRESSTLERS